MAKYFFVSNGPRSCYMPDDGTHIRCDTRKALKSSLEWEAGSLREAGFIGASKRNISRLAAEAWREANKEKPTYLNPFLPLRLGHAQRGNYSYGIFVAVSNRADYLAETENY